MSIIDELPVIDYDKCYFCGAELTATNFGTYEPVAIDGYPSVVLVPICNECNKLTS